MKNNSTKNDRLQLKENQQDETFCGHLCRNINGIRSKRIFFYPSYFPLLNKIRGGYHHINVVF